MPGSNGCEFVCLQSAGLPVTEGQLDDLVDMMDDDGNGEVDLALVLTYHNICFTEESGTLSIR